MAVGLVVDYMVHIVHYFLHQVFDTFLHSRGNSRSNSSQTRGVSRSLFLPPPDLVMEIIPEVAFARILLVVVDIALTNKILL